MEAVTRRVRPDEGPVLKAVRLAALADSPSAFGSSYAAEVDQPDDHWEALAEQGAAGESSVTFFAVIAGSVVGLVAGYQPDAAVPSVELVSMWVAPAQRRSGIAVELVDAVVGWARETGATTVELWVTRGNDAAVRLYETAGFHQTGDHQPLPSDPCKDELRMRRSVVHCRAAGLEDFPFLATMLGEAAVWRPDKPSLTADEVMADPRYAMYLAGWPRHGDYGLVAEHDGPVGAAWYRTYTEANHGYGFVAEDVPELSIAVTASRRHEGIGRRLLVDLIDASVAQGYKALSLSVHEENPARGLYESAGFVLVEQHGTSWTMVRHAGRSD